MKKQLVLLALALCLFVAAEMQGLPQDPAVTTVYVSGPSAHTIYETTWGEACSLGALTREVYAGGSQFRPTGIEFGSDGLIYFADNSQSEIGRLSLDGQQFEIISDSSVSTLENPTDIIFTATDAIVSSRAGSNKSTAGLYIIRNIAGLPIGESGIPLPELLSAFGSGGGSSAESFAVLYDRNLVGTEASDDEVLEFTFNTPTFPYTDFTPVFPTGGVPLGIAGTGVGSQEVIYVGFPKTGEILKYDRNNPEVPGAPFAVLPDRYKPRHIETDLAGNVYVAASRQDNGSNGALFCIPPSGGVTHKVVLDSAYGVAVGAGGSITANSVDFTGGDSLKLCGDEIRLVSPGGDVTTVTVTCQDITPADFKAQLDPAVFPLDEISGTQPVECIPEPGKKSCTLITVEGINSPGLVTDFIRTMVPFVDFTLASTDVGILYRPTDSLGDPVGLFSENILTQLEIVDWGFDPGRLTGSKDNFGSEVVFCTGCNTEPVCEAGDSQSICEGTDLTLSGTVEDFALIIDSYVNPGDERELLTVDWTLKSGPTGANPTINTNFDSDTLIATATISGSELPAGDYEFTLTAEDAEGLKGTDDVAITVTADNTAPVISSASATPDLLWPPNHEMIEVAVDVVATDACSAFTCYVSSISYNDPDDDLGDGTTSDDYAITGASTVMLRAERNQAKGNDPETDRIYTITVTCEDAAGNKTLTTLAVTVLEDQGGN